MTLGKRNLSQNGKSEWREILLYAYQDPPIISSTTLRYSPEVMFICIGMFRYVQNKTLARNWAHPSVGYCRDKNGPSWPKPLRHPPDKNLQASGRPVGGPDKKSSHRVVWHYSIIAVMNFILFFCLPASASSPWPLNIEKRLKTQLFETYGSHKEKKEELRYRVNDVL